MTIGVRPEAWVVQANGDGGSGLDVTVAVVEELGSESFLYCTDAGGGDGRGRRVGPQVVRQDARGSARARREIG